MNLWHFLNELIKEVEEYFILWDSTRRMRRETLAVVLDNELVAKFAKSLWNYIMRFIFKQRKFRIYGGTIYAWILLLLFEYIFKYNKE